MFQEEQGTVKCLPPWISKFTSNLLAKLNTQRILSKLKPTNYKREQVTKLENLITELSEQDNEKNQTKLFHFRKLDRIFKHLKNPKKSPSLPKKSD